MESRTHHKGTKGTKTDPGSNAQSGIQEFTTEAQRTQRNFQVSNPQSAIRNQNVELRNSGMRVPSRNPKPDVRCPRLPIRNSQFAIRNWLELRHDVHRGTFKQAARVVRTPSQIRRSQSRPEAAGCGPAADYAEVAGRPEWRDRPETAAPKVAELSGGRPKARGPESATTGLVNSPRPKMLIALPFIHVSAQINEVVILRPECQKSQGVQTGNVTRATGWIGIGEKD